MEIEWNLLIPTHKNWLNIETDDTTHAPRKYEEIDYLRNEAFWGEHCRVPGLGDPGALLLG